MATVPGVDLYGLLGLPPGAGPDEINAAFRTRAKELHPDRVHGDIERFKELSLAYGVLSDPVRRRRYDDARAATRAVSRPPSRAPEPVSVLRTRGRASAALWGGLALVVGGIVLAAIVPSLGSATKGTTIGRDLTLWISAAKLVVCGAVLAVVGGRRLRHLRAHPSAGSSWRRVSSGANGSPSRSTRASTSSGENRSRSASSAVSASSSSSQPTGAETRGSGPARRE